MTPDSDLLWKQYTLHVDLYKFYLDLAVKINVFYYAVTGAIVTYYFQHVTDQITRYALLLPIAFSLAISGLFFYGANRLSVVREELFSIRDKLGLATAPEIQTLVVFLISFGVIMAGTCVALIVVFFRAA